jgi:transcriptional regulator with XRE-family HTH domain
MDIKERLQIIISKHNLNASSFADRLKIQRSNLSHILSGRNKPSIDFIEKFISNFPEEDIQWLITGKQTQTNNIESNQADEIKDRNLLALKKKSIKKEVKIITFYEDNTFDVFYPNS